MLSAKPEIVSINHCFPKKFCASYRNLIFDTQLKRYHCFKKVTLKLGGLKVMDYPANHVFRKELRS